MCENVSVENINNLTNIAQKEHFVPKSFQESFYYNGTKYYDCCFLPSQNNNFKISFHRTNSGRMFWKDYLYELFIDNEMVLSPNLIEKYFGTIETNFPDYKSSLLKKIKVATDADKTFLTTDEVKYWKTFIIVQFLRLPKTINTMQTIIESRTSVPATKQQFKTAILLSLFPVLEELTGKTLFDISISSLQCNDYGLLFLKNETDSHFYTSDIPLFFDNISIKEGILVMPISPFLAISLIPYDKLINPNQNLLLSCSENNVREINDAIMQTADEYLVCDHFSESEKEYIKNFYKTTRNSKI